MRRPERQWLNPFLPAGVGRNPPVEMKKKNKMTAYLQHWRRRAACLPNAPVGMGMAPAQETELVGMLRPPVWLKEVSERLERGSTPSPNLPSYCLWGKCMNGLI